MAPGAKNKFENLENFSPPWKNVLDLVWNYWTVLVMETI